jgi:iron complex transport system ATP-binding protein
MSFLKVEDLISGYKEGFKLNNVSFSIEKTNFCGIIGPNGSGKSTLLKTIAGILMPENGKILLNNEDINSMDTKIRSQKIAYVGQFIENKELKVFDYVIMGRLPYFKSLQVFETKEDIEIVNYYLNLFGIYEYKDRFLFELSGGQQQLVSICTALVQTPDLLLLDEPTAHLDLKYQIDILDLLYSLHENSKLTIITVFHDLNLASEYCDYLILLKKGEIIERGHPEKVIDYRILEKVYNIVILTRKNPISNKPFVIPVPKKRLKK